nr:unnamed protein product [Spirometra erinaceieuropaei]
MNPFGAGGYVNFELTISTDNTVVMRPPLPTTDYSTPRISVKARIILIGHLWAKCKNGHAGPGAASADASIGTTINGQVQQHPGTLGRRNHEHRIFSQIPTPTASTTTATATGDHTPDAHRPRPPASTSLPQHPSRSRRGGGDHQHHKKMPTSLSPPSLRPFPISGRLLLSLPPPAPPIMET